MDYYDPENPSMSGNVKYSTRAGMQAIQYRNSMTEAYDPENPKMDGDVRYSTRLGKNLVKRRNRVRMATIDELALDDMLEDEDDYGRGTLEQLLQKEKNEEEEEKNSDYDEEWEEQMRRWEDETTGYVPQELVDNARGKKKKKKNWADKDHAQEQRQRIAKLVGEMSALETKLFTELGDAISELFALDPKMGEEKAKAASEKVRKQLLESADKRKALSALKRKISSRFGMTGRVQKSVDDRTSRRVKRLLSKFNTLVQKIRTEMKRKVQRALQGAEDAVPVGRGRKTPARKKGIFRRTKFARMNRRIADVRRRRKAQRTSPMVDRLELVDQVVARSNKLGRLVSRKSLLEVPTQELARRAKKLKQEVEDMRMKKLTEEDEEVPFDPSRVIAKRPRRATRARSPPPSRIPEAEMRRAARAIAKRQRERNPSRMITDKGKRLLNWEPVEPSVLLEIQTDIEMKKLKDKLGDRYKREFRQLYRQQIRKGMYEGAYDTVVEESDYPDYAPGASTIIAPPVTDSDDFPDYRPPSSPSIDSPAYNPGSPGYVPGSPGYFPDSPGYVPGSPAYMQAIEEEKEMEDLDLGEPAIMDTAALRKRMREKARGKRRTPPKRIVSLDTRIANMKRKKKKSPKKEYVREWSCNPKFENAGVPLVPRMYIIGGYPTERVGDERIEYVRLLPMHKSGRPTTIKRSKFENEFVERSTYERRMMRKYNELLEDFEAEGGTREQFDFAKALCPKKKRKKKKKKPSSPRRAAAEFSIGDVVEKVKGARKGEQVRITKIENGKVGGVFVSDGKTCRKSDPSNFSK